MAIKVVSEQEVVQEAAAVLLKHMSPAKVARFWAASKLGGGDYLVMRERLFAEETVDSLYEQVRRHQAEKDTGA